MHQSNYKSFHTRDSLKKSVPQESFHAHFKEESHNGVDDWQFIFIDKAENVEQLRKKDFLAIQALYICDRWAK